MTATEQENEPNTQEQAMAAKNTKPATAADETEHATTAENVKTDMADDEGQEAAEDIMDLALIHI